MNMNDRIGYSNSVGCFARICYRLLDMIRDWIIKRGLSGKGLK